MLWNMFLDLHVLDGNAEQLIQKTKENDREIYQDLNPLIHTSTSCFNKI